MRITLGILCVLLASATALAQTTAPSATISHLSRSAEGDLARSLADLARLRSKVESEKLPLAQQLTAQEEKLDQLRKQNSDVVRSADNGSLELVKIRGEIKARQDELAYVGKVLDEYTKEFETKINVAETQYLGEAIDAAKQATANQDLSMGDKFSRQTLFVGISIKRIFDAIGGMRFPGVGVDTHGTVVDGNFALVGPVALFSSKSGAAGMVIPQTGSSKPLIRPLDEKFQAGLIQVVDTGAGTLPLDPSRGAALKQLVQKFNLVRTFQKGGPVMWPLLLASILSLGTVLERLVFLLSERMNRSHKALRRFFAAMEKNNIDEAISISKESRFFVVRALGYALQHRQEETLSSALIYAQARELKRFQRGIPILDTVITLAPLLGLLGTVTGMMGSFALVGGEISSSGAITGGIAEALIATAFGLGIAITSLLPFNFLNARIDEARHELESAAAQLEILVRSLPDRAGGRPPGLAHDSAAAGGAKNPAANTESHFKPVIIDASVVRAHNGEPHVSVAQP